MVNRKKNCTPNQPRWVKEELAACRAWLNIVSEFAKKWDRRFEGDKNCLAEKFTAKG